jgi:arylsulfatase A-like enzyme
LYFGLEDTVASPANLILIQSDNHSRKILGCYDHEIVKTPTLDKLASRGIRFANAYTASPLCVPARAAMATGRFPHQTGYWDNAIAYDARIPSWMHRIREQGHTVVGIGKFHYRSSDQDNGFSEEFVDMHLHGGRGAVRNLLRGFNSELPGVDDARWDLYAKRSGPGGSHYQDYDRQVTRKAIEWLREHAAASKKPTSMFTLRLGQFIRKQTTLALGLFADDRQLPFCPRGERTEEGQIASVACCFPQVALRLSRFRVEGRLNTPCHVAGPDTVPR